MSIRPVRLGALLALGLLLGTGAGATSIANLSVSNGSTNVYNDAGVTGYVGQSSTSVLANDPTGFDLRYAAVVGADTGGGSVFGTTYTQNFTGSFTITFEVTQTAGWNWTVNVDVIRNGALSLVTDGSGNASVTLSALSVVHSGAGVLGSSLGLGAVGTLSGGAGGEQAFNQNATAAITGTGTGSAQVVTLVFSFTASATTVDPAFGQANGDEAALRMGIDSPLSSFTADDYPGVGSRTLANDGIFVSAAVPEPAAEALLALGLIGLAWFDSKRKPV